MHNDSILRRDNTSDSKRKLINRGLAVSALCYPYSLETDNANSDQLVKYIDMASNAGIPNIIVRVESECDFELISTKLSSALKRAENTEINILFETVGYLSDTSKVIELINYFSSAAIGASWNVRGTYFGAGENAETTIKILGAYIKYVRLGDMKNGKTVFSRISTSIPYPLAVWPRP